LLALERLLSCNCFGFKSSCKLGQLRAQVHYMLDSNQLLTQRSKVNIVLTSFSSNSFVKVSERKIAIFYIEKGAVGLNVFVFEMDHQIQLCARSASTGAEKISEVVALLHQLEEVKLQLVRLVNGKQLKCKGHGHQNSALQDNVRRHARLRENVLALLNVSNDVGGQFRYLSHFEFHLCLVLQSWHFRLVFNFEYFSELPSIHELFNSVQVLVFFFAGSEVVEFLSYFVAVLVADFFCGLSFLFQIELVSLPDFLFLLLNELLNQNIEGCLVHYLIRPTNPFFLWKSHLVVGNETVKLTHIVKHVFAFVQKQVVSKVIGQHFVIRNAKRCVQHFQQAVEVLGWVDSTELALVHTRLNVLSEQFQVFFVQFLGVLVEFVNSDCVFGNTELNGVI
jgi:hypothetical protein